MARSGLFVAAVTLQMMIDESGEWIVRPPNRLTADQQELVAATVERMGGDVSTLRPTAGVDAGFRVIEQPGRAPRLSLLSSRGLPALVQEEDESIGEFIARAAHQLPAVV